ncbi:Leishmanolysin-like peptidase 2, partial [Plecturocebus cupreus]
MRSHYVAKAGLELFASSNPPISASQSTESRSVSRRQTGEQWHDLGSLRPPPPGFKQFSCLSLPDGVSLCCPGWSAVAPSRLTATSVSQAQRWGFTILARLVLNSQTCNPPTPAFQSAEIT